MNNIENGSAAGLRDWASGVSLGAGLALLGAGLRRGGLFGAAAALAGGLLLVRGAGTRNGLARRLPEPPLSPADKARYAHMPLDSEVHSPDFTAQRELPDSTPMGHETHVPPRRS